MLDLNRKTSDDRTNGFIGMQINMPERDGPVHLRPLPCHRNWRDGIPQGWLARDHPAWSRSTHRLNQLERLTKDKVVPSHDETTFLELQVQQNKDGGFFT
ncbi:unnamed protein product [Zymoseptoria tritici ST99CH_3D7]|uniref:Uncharacterized protein n=2 Tax=Zymoseptoria tritici TaxID=1047171 RepID=A0A1X7RU39_ZYMT9|nr:unnamed protein product [Zymoseptoria tritici ST99CH_3D7]SMR52621.1 unnamed protein product [Zymoseptoria tritici ST99CH_1E4]